MALPLKYHWRNLFVRKATTVLTILVIAAVIGVFTWVTGFNSALKSSLAVASDDRKILVLKRGSTSETNSAIPVDEYAKLNQLTEMARDPNSNEPLLSPEMMTQLSRPRIRDEGKTWGNIAMRGVTDAAFKVHSNVKLISGRQFSTGAQELIVGATTARQFSGLNIGDELQLGYSGNREYTIVGTFSASGGPMESEVWGYLPSLLNSYNRTMYSSAALRIKDGVDPERVLKEIEGPAIQMSAWTEPAYWKAQTENIGKYLVVTSILVTAMALAAIFSIANTMFSMVAGRTREVAMLRTIGFSQTAILAGFVIEAVFLSVIGGILGCIGCMAWLAEMGNTKDMFGASSFTSLAFDIHLTAWTVGTALAAVVIVGVVGALVPAMRASRVAVISALREP
ncbi:MAG: ABC transporter permease [Planctomycetes bacterium]|nr:ABC transporter permease [Planctomycetota bacterium]MBI3833661.1 ABC transporter permease [Planctomycetota bacterium]